MLKYKMDILDELKIKGYNTTIIRKEHIFGESTLTKLRNGLYVDMATLDRLCALLSCNVSDLIEYVSDDEKP